MRTIALLLTATFIACGPTSDPSQPPPASPNVPHVGPTDAQPGVATAPPALECRAGHLASAVSSVDGKTELRAEALTLNPAAGRPDRSLAVFTAPAGALWVAAPHRIEDATPTRVHGLLAPSDPTARALCGTGSVTWSFHDVAGDVALGDLTALPSCEDGEPVEGTIEACIDVLGHACDGEAMQLVSTVPGHERRSAEGELYFGGLSGGPIVFTLPGVSGAAQRGGSGYALFEPESTSPTLFCVTEVTHQPSRSNRAARLVLSGLRRLGRCDEGEPLDGAHLETCARWR
jgi:hypothetical protein